MCRNHILVGVIQDLGFRVWEFPKNRGTFFRGPSNKISILGCILGYPYLGLCYARSGRMFGLMQLLLVLTIGFMGFSSQCAMTIGMQKDK